jgi:SPP1 family predicted phage head-tail adaptor
MKGVISGRLDRLITFQEKVKNTNEFNEDIIVTWRNLTISSSVYASVKQNPGDEQYDADKLTYITPVVFTIRYRTDLTQEMQIVYNSNEYDIISIAEPIGFRRTLLEIKAVARI